MKRFLSFLFILSLPCMGIVLRGYGLANLTVETNVRRQDDGTRASAVVLAREMAQALFGIDAKVDENGKIVGMGSSGSISVDPSRQSKKKTGILMEASCEVPIDLSKFRKAEVSFTYPDGLNLENFEDVKNYLAFCRGKLGQALTDAVKFPGAGTYSIAGLINDVALGGKEVRGVIYFTEAVKKP